VEAMGELRQFFHQRGFADALILNRRVRFVQRHVVRQLIVPEESIGIGSFEFFGQALLSKLLDLLEQQLVARWLDANDSLDEVLSQVANHWRVGIQRIACDDDSARLERPTRKHALDVYYQQVTKLQ
jgi:hypothetical protein